VVNSPLRCVGMARVLKGSQFYLHTPHKDRWRMISDGDDSSDDNEDDNDNK